MFEIHDIHPDASVQESEYKRLLGFPRDYVLEGRARELAEETREWYKRHGKPWIFARQAENLHLGNGSVDIGGTVFSSRQLHDSFYAAEAHSAVLTVVSAGKECEERAGQFWREGKPDEYFFMEMFGSAVVEHLVAVAAGRICAWADGQVMVALPNYSPGYSGWDVAEQPKLWKLIRQSNGHFPGELDVLESGMLRPKKSLLTVFGLTRHLDKVRPASKLIPCENCSLPGCQFRRAPFLHTQPQLEDVRRLQAENCGNHTHRVSGLRQDAKYSINVKALRKWSQERLELKTTADGSVEARFRYEGTTCSNMGRPLAYDFRVLLGPAAVNHRILQLSCRPAPGDTGHAAQCKFITDSAAFAGRIEGEKPLLGQPLDDVLEWKRSFNPSGCFCEAESRQHKWGLVFEVIHYALVQREKEQTAEKPNGTSVNNRIVQYDKTL